MLSVENTWKELKDSSVGTAVISFGSIEQHGYHLPLGTDWIIAQETARRLAEELDAYLLPTMPFGCSREHMGFPGTITLKPATLASVLEDIVESLMEHGIKKIVVVNSHGGNWVLKPIVRELNYKYPDLSILWADGPLPHKAEPVPEDIHSGREETSTMMYLRPDLIREINQEFDSPGIVGQEFNDYIGFEKTTKTGAWGKPSEASDELGRLNIEKTLKHQTEYIRWALQRVDELRGRTSIVDTDTE